MAQLAATSRIAAHRSAIKLDFSISHDRNSVLILCIIVVAVFFFFLSRVVVWAQVWVQNYEDTTHNIPVAWKGAGKGQPDEPYTRWTLQSSTLQSRGESTSCISSARVPSRNRRRNSWIALSQRVAISAQSFWSDTNWNISSLSWSRRRRSLILSWTKSFHSFLRATTLSASSRMVRRRRQDSFDRRGTAGRRASRQREGEGIEHVS